LNVLEVTRFGLDFNHFVERWHDLHGHGVPAALRKELVKQDSQAVTGSVFSRNALDVDRLVL